jgi:hypothetical protein
MHQTFDSCLAQFEAVIERSRREQDRVGLFAAMYAGVTRSVRAGCGEGAFAEPVRMERFVTAFADRYFVAHDAWREARQAPAVWATAFDAARRWRPIVLQHLLLGMNAHINLDLGVVTAELAGGPDGLPALRPDFDAVNDVLATMVDPAQRALTAASPWFGLIDSFGARSDEAVINFSLRRARQQAWALAQRLVALPPEQQQVEIDRVDRAVDGVARRILHPGAALSTGMLLVRMREPWRATRAVDVVTAGPAGSP